VSDGTLTTGYVYNALGQRVKKSNGTSTTYFAYDESGHLLGEYDGAGDLIQEIVWLQDMPVASIRPDGVGGIGIFYIHTDHLNAPRKLTRPSDNVIVWRLDSDPFGAGTPDQDPDGNSLSVVFNLRFPGQYFDAETGTSYSYFRDYDPVTGRYFESDPIGLEGGINTYAYVGGHPTISIDPFGLAEPRGRSNSQGYPITFPIFPSGPSDESKRVAGLQLQAGLKAIASAYLCLKLHVCNEMLNEEEKAKPDREQKPNGCPTGTRPVDRDKRLDREKIHRIKDGISAEPNDWVGISPDGRIWTNSNGRPVDNGPFSDYLP
jgi:RHS repeat-associated protein